MAYQYETIKLDKSMYRCAGATFSQILEQQDPGHLYKGTELEGMDAFQRQLKRFDIKVKGPDSDCVEKFFRTADSAVLFPEYISRCVRQGMEEVNILPHITACVTRIDGMDYRSLTTESGDHTALREVDEGAAIPATTIRAQGNLVQLVKRGRMLVASYEAVRSQKLDLFSITLRQLGAGIAAAQLADAVKVLCDGDGNNNPAVRVKTAQSGKLTYEDLVSFWVGFGSYEMNTLLVSDDMMASLLALPEFRTPVAGMNVPNSGKLMTPLGATLLRVPQLPAGTMIGLDKRYALELVESGGVSVEYDKLIDRQLERAAVTVTAGYAKLFPEAGKILEV